LSHNNNIGLSKGGFVMMKKKLVLPAVFMLICGMLGTSANADMALYDWAVNIDGTVSEIGLGGDPVPAEVDVSLFDVFTGLGTITVTLGAGTHSVDLFVDHELSESINTYYNETGAAFGAPAAGQSWEIDEPGWVNGDIYENFKVSALDGGVGTSIYGDTVFPDDVSMAMGWDFTGPGATINFYLSNVAPATGFYLGHFDPDSQESVYFSSDLTIVPVPGAVLLGGIGLAFAGWLGKRRKEIQA